MGGAGDMSLVIAICAKDYIIAVGEKIEMNDKEEVISNGFNKLVKIGNNMIAGCTGKVSDNLELFNGLIELHPDNGFVSNCQGELPVPEILNVLFERYNFMGLKHHSGVYTYSLFSFLCWRHEGELLITVFSLSEDENIPQGVMHVAHSENEPYAFVFGGNSKHADALKKKLELQQPKTILQYKRIMKEVIDEGVLFDKKINNQIHFEIISKEDFIEDEQ